MSWLELETLICTIGIYTILAMSLNVINGMTGLLHIGHAGFFAVGAYAAGLTSIYCTIPELGWFNLLISAAVAMALAVVFSLVIGIPCLRLRGDYLAIATLAFGEVVRLSLSAMTFPPGKMFADPANPDLRIGGATALEFTMAPEQVWGAEYAGYSAGYASFWVIWVVVLLTYVILRNLKFSRAGRAFMCIREDEIAAQAMGINVPGYKTISFVLSAAFAGLAGALFFHHQQAISPGDFTLLLSIEVLLMVVLGGQGSFVGAFLAAVLLRLLRPLLQNVDLSGVSWLPAVMRTSLSEYDQILYAVLLIVLIRIAPNGMLGTHELPRPLTRRWRPRKGGTP